MLLLLLSLLLLLLGFRRDGLLFNLLLMLLMMTMTMMLWLSTAGWLPVQPEHFCYDKILIFVRFSIDGVRLGVGSVLQPPEHAVESHHDRRHDSRKGKTGAVGFKHGGGTKAGRGVVDVLMCREREREREVVRSFF